MTAKQALAFLGNPKDFDAAVESVDREIRSTINGYREGKYVKSWGKSFVKGIDNTSVFVVVKSGYSGIDGTVYQIVVKSVHHNGCPVHGGPIAAYAAFFGDLEEARRDGFTSETIKKHVAV